MFFRNTFNVVSIFIDFGFLIKRTELEEISEKSTFEYAKFHWSRPLELGYLNRNVYESIKNYHPLPTDAIDPGKPNDGITPFIAMIKNTENNKNFDNIYLDLFQNYQTLIYKNIIDDIDSYDEYNEYNVFRANLINTIDSYGVGIALMYVLNKTFSFIDFNLATELKSLFYFMFHPVLK